jgi:hypothetical protein
VADAPALTAERPAVAARRPRPLLHELFLETFAVILGVTVALLANGWAAEREHRARAAAARASIEEELRANRAAVAAARDYHGRLMDALGPRMAPGQPAPELRLFAEGFINPAETLTTAWDAARATGVLEHMDYDDVLAFSRLYARQERYEGSAETGGRVIYEGIFERGTAGLVENFRNLFSVIAASWYLEEELLAEYREVLGPDSTAAPSPDRPGARRR